MKVRMKVTDSTHLCYNDYITGTKGDPGPPGANGTKGDPGQSAFVSFNQYPSSFISLKLSFRFTKAKKSYKVMLPIMQMEI